MRDMAIKHGLFLPQGFTGELAGFQDAAAAWQALTGFAQAADADGYETIWVADHLHNAMGSQDMLFECWTTTTALLRDTRRIRVGQLVTCNGYRNPALQAKMASTLDVISGGRLTFGIGAGWWEPDYRAYGYEYPGSAERLSRLEEAAQVILALWTEDKVTVDGRYYQVKDAVNQPKGIQRPHVPLMIAGGGEKVTLKLVARYGDLCNLVDDPATIERKLAVLRKHCADAGRDYASIRKTAMTLCIIGETDADAAALVPPWAPQVFTGDIAQHGLVGTVDTIRRRLADYEAAGVDELAISFHDAPRLDMMRAYASAFLSGADLA
jgi:F420-dependent oxidoreductase-like protein